MNVGSPAVFLASAAAQNERMAALAEADGDLATAEKLRDEAATVKAQAEAALQQSENES